MFHSMASLGWGAVVYVHLWGLTGPLVGRQRPPAKTADAHTVPLTVPAARWGLQVPIPPSVKLDKTDGQLWHRSQVSRGAWHLWTRALGPPPGPLTCWAGGILCLVWQEPCFPTSQPPTPPSDQQPASRGTGEFASATYAKWGRPPSTCRMGQGATLPGRGTRCARVPSEVAPGCLSSSALQSRGASLGCRSVLGQGLARRPAHLFKLQAGALGWALKSGGGSLCG